jgi:preprotein translocase subunit YajC
MHTAVLFFLQRSGGPGLVELLLPFLMIGFLWFFMIARPQRARQRAHDEMLSSLKNGDKVITTGGIHGTVTEVGEQVVQIRIAESVKINVSRNAIAALQEPKKEISKESEKR